MYFSNQLRYFWANLYIINQKTEWNNLRYDSGICLAGVTKTTQISGLANACLERYTTSANLDASVIINPGTT
jgi:hypothetical protein